MLVVRAIGRGAAEQELLKFQAMMWQVNDIANAISITFILANIWLAQGRLRPQVTRSVPLAETAQGLFAQVGKFRVE